VKADDGDYGIAIRCNLIHITKWKGLDTLPKVHSALNFYSYYNRRLIWNCFACRSYGLQLGSMAIVDLQSIEVFIMTDDDDNAPDWLSQSHGGQRVIDTEDSGSSYNGLEPSPLED
jgi:hypothetical protein